MRPLIMIPPMIIAKAVEWRDTQIFNSRFYVTEHQQLPGELSSICIDYSGYKIRGTVERRSRTVAYCYNNETKAYDDGGVVSFKSDWTPFRKQVVHFTPDEFEQFLDI